MAVWSRLSESVDVQSFAPAGLAEGGASAQITVLVALLVLGLLIFIIDHADRAYWISTAGELPRSCRLAAARPSACSICSAASSACGKLGSCIGPNR